MLNENQAETALNDLFTEASKHQARCKLYSENYTIWDNITYRLASEINSAERANRNSFIPQYVSPIQVLENVIKEVKALSNNPRNGAYKRRMWAKWAAQVEKYLA